MKKQFFRRLIFVAVCFMLAACGRDNTQNETQEQSPAANVLTGQLQILATSDMHAYLMNYDYYTTSESNNFGLVKLATLIKEFKEGKDNVVLVDNGDLIQGNPLGDYFARVKPVQKGTAHPAYLALGELGYDAAGIGNHEFNYGLDFLKQIIQDSPVPIINANVYNAQTEQNEFKPYVIVPKKILDEKGMGQAVQVGIISFVPTQILNWDKIQLEGKVTVEDIKACAEKFVPIMKTEGADIIIALTHSGYGSSEEYIENSENVAYYLTLMDDIDVVIGGHSHDTFPSEGFLESTNYEKVDLERGTINDTFTVQPGKYAEALGVISLQLRKGEDGYEITSGTTSVLSAQDVANDLTLEAVLKPYHDQVISYVNEPVGEITAPIDTFFALVSDNAGVQIISDAQLDYAKQMVEEDEVLTPYQNLPILSAAAPFKAGLSKDGTKADDYVMIPAGNIAIKDVASLYKYPNTVSILKLKGSEVREWLEMSAGLYNTIGAESEGNPALLNNQFAAFNFDTIDGVTYEIDITQPARYDLDGNLIDINAHRIIDLQYQGEALKDDQEFLVVTNNYRAGGGGNFPIFNGETSAVIYNSSDETRQVILDYIMKKGVITPKADGNWRIRTVEIGTNPSFLSNTEAENELTAYPYIIKSKDAGEGLTEFLYKLNAKS